MSPPKLSKCPGASCELEEKIEQVLSELEKINRAFPDGPESHRIAHEAMIKAAVAEERFWNELKIDVAKKGVWGLLIIILGLSLVGLAAKFGISVAR